MATESDIGKLDTMAGEAELPPPRGDPYGPPPVEDWDHYELVKGLGRGGMGTVWQARDLRLGRTVALKFIRGEDGDRTLRFQQEARAQARISHPNICQVYEVGSVQNKAYIAMQFVDGKTLHKAAASMSLLQKVCVIRDVAFALHEAHKLGILHRDLKPDNILVERQSDGRYHPVVMDFGLARESSENSGLTESGVVMGTPAYMSPEQARGDLRNLDRRADVYSLGATLYELLTGMPPFGGSQVVDVLMAVVNDEPVGVRSIAPQLPSELDTIVMKCLSKEPNQRYENARALGEDLQRHIDGEPILGRRRSLLSRLRQKARRHRALVALGLLLLVTLTTATVQFLSARMREIRQATRAREETAETRYLAQEIKNIEWMMRSAYQLPLHDIGRERALVQKRIERLEQRMRGFGLFGQAMAHEALGRGYLILQDYQKAHSHLSHAIEFGQETASVDYAMGVALGQLYLRELEDAQRGGDVTWFKVIEPKIRSKYLTNIRYYLNKGKTSEADSADLLEAFIAFYNEDYDSAINHINIAFTEMPWLYEAKKLEADVHHLRARTLLHDGNYEQAHDELRQASALYEQAAAVGRSDPALYEALSEVWRSRLRLESVHRQRLGLDTLPSALSAADRAIATAPWRPYGYVQKAWMQYHATLRNKDSIQSCITTANQAVKSDVNAFMAYDVLSTCRQHQISTMVARGEDPATEMKPTLASIKQAMNLNAEHPAAYDKLGSYHLVQMKININTGKDGAAEYLSSIRNYDISSKLNPESSNIYNNIILVTAERIRDVVAHGWFAQGEFDRAKKGHDSCKEKDANQRYCDIGFLDILASRLTYNLQAGLPVQELDREFRALAYSILKVQQGERAVIERLLAVSLLQARQGFLQGQDPSKTIRDIDAQLPRCAESLTKDPACAAIAVQRDWLLFDATVKQRPALNLLQHALTVASETVDDNPRSVAARQLLAEAHLRLAGVLANGAAQHATEGLRIAEQALRLNPNHPLLLATQGALFLRQGQYTVAPREKQKLGGQARAALERAFSLNKHLKRDFGIYLSNAAAMEAGFVLR